VLFSFLAALLSAYAVKYCLTTKGISILAKGIAVESTQHQFFIGASTWNEKPGSFAQIFIQNTLVFAFGM
jgi:hypothetical protein